MTARLRNFLPVLLPLSIFVGHVCIFGNWLVDDAGIVFSVARNLAQGLGLVCQAGGDRVEAFSSLPWVAVMASTFFVGIFHLIWVPKVVSVVLIAAAFGTIYLALEKAAPWGKWVALAALCWTSLQTAFVVWTVSGLENPLNVFILSVLVAYGLRDISSANDGGCPGRIGLTAALAGVARPEGVIYVFAYPIWRLLWAVSGQQKDEVRPRLRDAGCYTIAVGSLLIAFFLFRWFYFGELLPNTYYAKGGPSREMIFDLLTLREPMVTKFMTLMEGIAGRWASGWVLVLVCGGTIWLWSRRLAHPIHSILASLLAFSAAAYLLLPGDWMGEHRYATAFFLFFYLYVSALLWIVLGHVAGPQKTKTRAVTFAVVSSVVLLGNLWLAGQRSIAFARHPTLPIQEVIDSGKHFERLTAILGVKSASVLSSSVGGVLLESKLRIYDLGMLCDRVIAHSLGEGVAHADREAFHDYIFENVRPTLISTSAYHTWLARLDEDPRFRRDYVPIKEYADQWVWLRYGMTVYSGEFVRRDALSGKLDMSSRLQEEARKTRYFGCAECE